MVSEVIQSELCTVGDWIRWTASRLQEHQVHLGHGTDNAWDEAVQLVLQALYLPVESDAVVFYARVTTPEKKTLATLIKRRIEDRVPLPYLTHQAWFMGMPFYVDERVLIPRSSIGEWIERHFEPWLQEGSVSHILEIGTGSGCIAIGCAKAFPEAQVDAIDISAEALAVATRNIQKHHVEDQVYLYQSDVYEALPLMQYDLIVSNPPYVSAVEMETLPSEYRHEPRLALAADDMGLAIVERILQGAVRYLKPTGILVVEVGNTEEAVMARYSDVPFVWLSHESGEGGVFLLTAEEIVRNFSPLKKR